MEKQEFEALIDTSPFICDAFREKCKEYLGQVETRLGDWIYANTKSHIAYQGDVVDCLDFIYTDFDEGKEGVRRLKDQPCLLLSHTCDMDTEDKTREKCVSIAPVFSFKEFAEQKIPEYSDEAWKSFLNSVKANKITDILFLPAKDEKEDDFIVFLDKIYSIHSKLLNHRMRTGKTRIKLSLSQIGYYYFLIKLTYHFARYENNKEVIRG